MAFEKLLEEAKSIAGMYDQAVVRLATALGASDSTLHVHAGLLIFSLVWLVSKRPLANGGPLTAVILGAMFNEILDYLHQGFDWKDATLDILLTICWPAIITAVARRRR